MNERSQNRGPDVARFAESDEEAERKYNALKLRDPFPEILPALLSFEDIKKYVANTGMIYPFSLEGKHLKQASYAVKLLGRCIYWDENGTKQDITIKNKEEFLLRRNSIAFVSLEPTFRLPYYIALRFNLKIAHIHRGILLGTGPLIDPGFQGKLAVPLHNLTMNDYVLRGGDDLIWVEFTKINTQYYNDILKTILEQVKNIAPYTLDKYIAFPSGKNIKDVNDYLHKAFNGNPIRSSLSEIRDVADRAKKGVKRLEFGGILSLIAFVVAVLFPTYQLVTNTTKYIRDVRFESAQQLKRIESLESEVKSLQASLKKQPKKSKDNVNQSKDESSIK